MAVSPPGAPRPLLVAGNWQTGAVSEWRTPLVVMAWIPITLGLDHGSTLAQQYVLGILTWVLLLALLRRESTLVQVQTAIVICFATMVEYTFSPWLEVYTYRFDNVPAFVPPGHGLVYLAALCIGRSQLFTRHARFLVPPDRCGWWALRAVGDQPLDRSTRLPRVVVVRVPPRFPGVGPIAPAVRGCFHRRDVSRGDRNVAGHLVVGVARPDGTAEHGQPAERCGWRLRLVRPCGCHVGTRPRLSVGASRIPAPPSPVEEVEQLTM